MKFSSYFRSWQTAYYKNGAIIGKNGDFYTNVSVGSLFGLSLAKRFINLVQSGEISEHCAILEIGANDANLMCDFIQGIYTFAPNLLKNLSFHIAEPHEILRKIQLENFALSFGNKFKLNHYKNLNECKFDNVFVFANELLDTFECEIVRFGEMIFVKNHALSFGPADAKALEFVDKFGINFGEIPINMPNFIKILSGICAKIYAIFCDYGENFSPNSPSVRIYKNHQVFSLFEIKNLSEFYAKSDITYSVNFEIFAKICAEFGFKTINFAKQSVALFDWGILDIAKILNEKVGYLGYARAISQIKYLTNANFMGENFKIIEIQKQI